MLADLKKRKIDYSACIIGEPTSMKPITAHKGYNEYVTYFTGLSGHASNPERGVNAVEYAIRYSNKLMELRNELKKENQKEHFFLLPTRRYK